MTTNHLVIVNQWCRQPMNIGVAISVSNRGKTEVMVNGGSCMAKTQHYFH